MRERCGADIVKTETPEAGRNSHFAATLCLADGGRVFCKGVTADSGVARMHRREAEINHWLPALAPRLLWRLEEAGWLVLGFEHVDGRHADLSPGSPDLQPIAEALAIMARELTPSPEPSGPAYGEKMARATSWQKLRDDPPPSLDAWTRRNLDIFAALEPVASELVAGDTLAHTDMHELNLLMDGTAHVVDWAWAHRAAPWVDTAFLVIRLIQAGHNPDQAERWATRIDAWHTAPPTAVTAFATEVYGMWEHLRHVNPLPIREEPTRAARLWARHRAEM
jgi:hypothetical protein